ncbi:MULTISPECIES: CoA-transferase subunit beta [unclassified Rhodococcus (in: high G+C Gram-positive bacteria)]|uniref:CoA-transferase subunit beta n=1 Tax=unclassified Rhodococcus (in: high G+C Gram-positive bacteria) TaxID=192944 RepID=UPI00163ACE9B|nr:MULTISPECIES: CoA-transferase [unclassified Rhodococcus (in: high G+C Gram-positive bacteria)]MBC2641639.1 3-oxoadipate--succinyl-CoA transferase subunit B [Rhodococcus sp. 3A]MBC2893616.1 3-oxoadipate--succinyl-CoA transferase subunit B [Rhodococcus sp. 4CII]
MTTASAGAISATEVIVSVAARELAGKGRVFAGVGLPTLAVDLAKRTSNPDVELIYESGVCGAHPAAMAEGIADSVVVSGAESVVSMSALFGYVLQGGNVDVGFLGAAQIDRYGSLNTSIIGEWDKPTVRLPGAGGAVEIMPNAGEIFVVMRRHDPSAFPAELDFCTSPSPVRARESGNGIMPRGRGVTRVFTNLGVLSRQGPFDELELVSVHEGVSVDDVRAQTGWELRVADDLTVTAPPSAEEIHLLRDVIDKVRLYLR